MFKNIYPDFNRGSIKTENYFKDKKYSIPYMKINYYETGEVKDSLFFNLDGQLEGYCYYFLLDKGYSKKTHFKNGKKEGLQIVSFNDGKKIFQFYRGGELNGVEYVYNNNNKLLSEFLWIEGEAVMRKVLNDYIPGDTMFTVNENKDMIDSFAILEDTLTVAEYSIKVNQDKSMNDFETIGSLIIKNGKVDEQNPYNWYVCTNLKDTIQVGKRISVELNSYQNFYDDSMEVSIKIGDMNSNLEFKEQPEEFKLKKGNNSLVFALSNQNLGYNILTGKVIYKLNGKLLREVIFYDDYYVVE